MPTCEAVLHTHSSGNEDTCGQPAQRVTYVIVAENPLRRVGLEWQHVESAACPTHLYARLSSAEPNKLLVNWRGI